MSTDPLRQRYLQAMGIDLWVRRDALRVRAHPETLPVTPENAAAGSPDEDVGSLHWEALRDRVLGCTLCDLHRGRTQAVFGVGNHAAQWMIVGEAPGAEEDRQGEPFVGRAGQLLNRMLQALGLTRADVYIANVLKCRPPNNRDPRMEEVVQCQPYLKRQIELIQPRVILAVGRIAAQHLLGTQLSLSRLRGTVHQVPGGDTPVVVTYHPAYLLRSPRDKRKAWTDLCVARQVVRERQPVHTQIA